jgi:hypothetical protein
MTSLPATMFVRPSPTLHKSHHESLCTGNLPLSAQPWETILCQSRSCFRVVCAVASYSKLGWFKDETIKVELPPIRCLFQNY